MADREYLVLMTTPENADGDFEMLINAFKKIKPREPLPEAELKLPRPHPVLSIKEAIFAESESVPTESALGRVLASPCVSCPPAVPVAISGERLTEDSVKLFKHYGIASVAVVKESALL
jgi:arginine/lysine/ornithine decarboxylase